MMTNDQILYFELPTSGGTSLGSHRLRIRRALGRVLRQRATVEPRGHRQIASVVFVALRWTTPADSGDRVDAAGNPPKSRIDPIVGRVHCSNCHGGVSNPIRA